MRYRLHYEVSDWTDDEAQWHGAYQEFYVKDDAAARKRIKYIIKDAHEIGCSTLVPLRLLKITQRKTKKKEEKSVEVALREPRPEHPDPVPI